MAITPRRRSSPVSDASFTQAPRSLKELVTCKFSYLTKTSAPVSADSGGAGSNGVRSTCPAIVRRAASISANVTMEAFSRPEAVTLFPFLRRRSRQAPLALLAGPRQFRETVARGDAHVGFWNAANRHLARCAAARLRPDCEPRTVRRRFSAPRHGLRHRRDHHRGAAGFRLDLHLHFRPDHPWARLDLVLDVLASVGDLGTLSTMD